jgi:6-phosphogluconolactonase/glucosamine-6-phosphate isomerase/deaminase
LGTPSNSFSFDLLNDSAKNVSTAKSGQTKATVIKEHLFDKDTNKLPSKEIETTENLPTKKVKKYIKQWKLNFTLSKFCGFPD